jgi:glycosyltransferase involved in cell wall biosynthesis
MIRESNGLHSVNLVSYIVPCFNCENFILECLDSILGQTDVEIEIIIVNDGSSDRSLEFIRQFMASVSPNKVGLYSHQNQENRGVSASRMLGVKHARGDYIAFLDADDVLIDPVKTSRQVSIINANPNVVLVHSGVKIIGDIPSEALEHEQHFARRSALGPYRLSNISQSLDINGIANSTVLVRRQALAEFSYRQLFQVEDFVLWHLVSLAGSFYCLPDQLVGYRFHSATATSRYSKSLLIQHYSSIEFKLALAVKSPSIVQSVVALLSLFSSLSNLLALYSRNDMESDVPSGNWILRLASSLARWSSRVSCYAYRHFIP